VYVDLVILSYNWQNNMFQHIINSTNVIW